MRLLTQTVATLAISLVSALPATAQDGIFASYDDMRAQLDPLMKARAVDDVLILMGGSDEMTTEQLTGLRRQVESIYSQDFTQIDLIKRNEMGAGWRQELLAYYTGTAYIYVYMLLHIKDSATVAVNFRFNSDFHPMNAQF